ncbi:hypothetical protein LTR91_010007 [Friedmanniomyces endolithicus]|uniref:Uncharacterized protein n=1 Tax=Friedmanniomyces endolithicus TaxID=329885 RepID=A0AAN6KKE9_9PEZI|nr:hypothetical protein LTR57_002677 [Friedmanniomyces endolithicus]KAK0987195.1 hypothetical protein LTR91_010007 [Friedmanniomyces endolithicus]KAK0993497.1 hypothetical protein LTS01_007440 [Friedmanniomyces endolithicus]KAK1051223.1 hypothetical protein LTS16_002688 [Friedmanniomyces endolithicus]
MTQGLALELADKRIRVNCVVPGIVSTELWDKMGTIGKGDEQAQKLEAMGKKLPVGFCATGEHIAEAYLYAVRADYATGSLITIDQQPETHYTHHGDSNVPKTPPNQANVATDPQRQHPALLARRPTKRCLSPRTTPELRNAIYECLARDTTLTLALKPRRSKRPHPICGLLLASKQIYGEFRPLLLASARISIPIADFDFGTVIRAVEAISQDDLRALAANRRFYLTLFMAHAPKQTDLEGLAAWLGYRAEAEQDKDAPPTDQVPLHTLRFRYDAKIDPARSMVSRRNMRVALLTALIRKIAALGGHKNHTVEKRRMMRDLYRCKDELMGVERRADGELEKDIALTASTIDSPFFGFQYVPQYR